jgi:hypothetical protein
MSEPSQGGPKTPEGKAISRFNAIKHGILSKEVLISGEEASILNDFGESINLELQPVGPVEEIIVDRIISSFWRLRRALEIEKNTMEWNKEYMELDFGLGGMSLRPTEQQNSRKAIRDMIHNETIEKIMRYETTIERGIFRALHELERMQARRNGKDTIPPLALDVLASDDSSSFRKNDSD